MTSATSPIANLDLKAFIVRILAEDIGECDVTSAATIGADSRLTARIASREPVVIAGLPIAMEIFRYLDPEVGIEPLVAEGAQISAGTAVMRLIGNARAMLAAERSALNCLQHLTGIATLTRRYVDRIAGTGCILLDTRKTVPGLRDMEKYAARIGGARNHRMRLDDGILIKDNHIAAAGGVTEAVAAAVAFGSKLPVQVEIDTLDQIEPALAAGANSLLCDNMDIPTLRRAVEMVAGRVPIEASGGVRLETIGGIAETGVAFISVGRITQSAPAADIGLDYAPA